VNGDQVLMMNDGINVTHPNAPASSQAAQTVLKSSPA